MKKRRIIEITAVLTLICTLGCAGNRTALAESPKKPGPDLLPPAYVENSVIYFSGFSELIMQRYEMAFHRARDNAMQNLLTRMHNNALPELPPIPADAKTLSSAMHFIDGKRAEIIAADVVEQEIRIDENGWVYVLLSSTGAEVKK